MRNIQMAKGAHTVVSRCAKVKPGETVLIVTEPSRMSIAEELGAAVCAAGGEPVFCSILPRERDGQEPPAPAAAAMKAAASAASAAGTVWRVRRMPAAP